MEKIVITWTNSLFLYFSMALVFFYWSWSKGSGPFSDPDDS